MQTTQKELIEFLKYIKDVHTDEYGNLQVCDTGDHLDPTVENVVKQYLEDKKYLEDKQKKIPVYCTQCTWVAIEVPPSICPRCSGITKELKQ